MSSASLASLWSMMRGVKKTEWKEWDGIEASTDSTWMRIGRNVCVWWPEKERTFLPPSLTSNNNSQNTSKGRMNREIMAFSLSFASQKHTKTTNSPLEELLSLLEFLKRKFLPTFFRTSLHSRLCSWAMSS
jgi:hypothetical protein